MEFSRRHLLLSGGAFALGFAGLYRLMEVSGSPRSAAADGVGGVGYGPLSADPTGVLDLPRGFRVTVISRTGDAMDDGLLVPGMPDGMAAFAAPSGGEPGGGDGTASERMILVRNHELRPEEVRVGPFGSKNERLSRIKPEQIYDRGRGELPALGGTTTLVFNTRTQKVERQFLSLVGTIRNCAGGPTPWGSWLTCEEDVTRAASLGSGTPGLERDHGYVFEVPASAEIGLADPRPITGMGRFYHEAVGVDPRTGTVYLTEDRPDGLLYRYVPKAPGKVHEGGRLQALALRGRASADTRNWSRDGAIVPGRPAAVEWIDLEHIDSPKDDLRDRGFAKGAARFARGEGMWSARDSIFFCCTNGGRAKRGQVWRLTPGRAGSDGSPHSPDQLELYIESSDSSIMNMCDNVTVAPWGDLVLCEDGSSRNRVLGVTPEGRIYDIARATSGKSEFAGATFSPDGTTLFVNLQQEGLTLAVTGDWRRPG